MANNQIHPTALIDSDATLGKNVSIGPYTIIGPEVTIGSNTIIENHVTIKGSTRIGESNTIGPYTSIGLPAQDKAHRNESTFVEIGNHNEIREYVSINRGTLGGTGVTKIGDHNQLMINTHFGHDVSVGDHCMVANSTTLAGHVQMGSYVVTGGMSGIHQFCRIGDYAMLGGYSVAYQDIAPYMLCTGYRAQLLGLNKIGLERNGFNSKSIQQIHEIYSIFFCQGLVPQKALDTLKKSLQPDPILDRFVNFVSDTNRGIISKV
ncbi:MAG: acyl-ACP--UDP-N-acetylglucosamine O-acyltransferase [Deltaproteobacteria bacterium]|nr:acyl-ACP--UDP-N-acetylglucosamine O-acyltransferase [Deltaproteobacteria bacterium]MBT4088340.1 acyl-ACP--UDP-N-acetylglucosamine O-acyltransferase [Deltaproteobacteria bacterium]MBT4262609.1 acyl-ACP--UDP-N-acetylglucosamine O-acyltransferase [Deltaproteobacteria bacterium]MBT4640611.1 acyl-ACP--UDP-N-acetylglucosamine O-acyltransferase [Deltaproteobacteria bacterium]MBT6505038.1 acyl-ACP--UDP-N-acetylglucosamine O-acyltransferase [Deltaproteobacteria bacterium]